MEPKPESSSVIVWSVALREGEPHLPDVINVRIRVWKPLSMTRHSEDEDASDLINRAAMSAIDEQTEDAMVAFAVWDVSDDTVRQFTHFGPSDEEALETMPISVAYDGDKDGDVWVARLVLDYDETLPINWDEDDADTRHYADTVFGSASGFLWADKELGEDRVMTLHAVATSELLWTAFYGEWVRTWYQKDTGDWAGGWRPSAPKW